MAQVEIRTSDTQWSATRTEGRDGRVVVDVPAVERLTFAGKDMVRVLLVDAPSDCLNPNVMVPAAWVVGA